MELDREIKQKMVDTQRCYLDERSIPYRFITIRKGMPVVIVDMDTFYKIIDCNLENGGIIGRFIAQGENGWSAYMKTDDSSKYQLMENLTEYQASCFITDTEYGRKPKLSRYATGAI